MGKNKEKDDVDAYFEKYLTDDFIDDLLTFSDMLKLDEKYDLENMRLPLYSEVKGLVAMAFRNGPIEDIHADGRISQEEMKNIMKYAVNELYFLLHLRYTCPELYKLYLIPLFPWHWDDPITKNFDYSEMCRKYYEEKKKIRKIQH